VLGNTSRDLGQYLKHTLLHTEDSYYNFLTGQCKKYSLRPQGVQELKQALGITELPTTLPSAIEQELESGAFEYAELSQRQFHPLQFKPKHKKQRILNRYGYRYEFDIRTAAHTLILQYAQQLGYQQPTPTLNEYITAKEHIRKTLSEALGIDTATVKTMLTGILQGAVLSPWHTNTLFQELNYRRDVVERARNNQFIQDYTSEVRSIWKYIKLQKNITQRMNGKVKSGIYRELECTVRTCIQKYLNKHKNIHFFEHDGWTCREMPDVAQLIRTVRRTTGFKIELDCTIYEQE
jgi:hypothetical protein